MDWGELITHLGRPGGPQPSFVIHLQWIGAPRSFLSAARDVDLSKPIVLIQAGSPAP